MAASDRDIQDAERAKLEAIVAEHATERERFQLLLSGVKQNGVTLAQFEGTEPVGYLQPEPELLDRLARRVERRAKLGLPSVECAGDPPTRHGCRCLERALDQSEGSKRAVLKLAASFHWRPPQRGTDSTRPAKAPTPDRPEAPETKATPTGPPPKPEPEPPPSIVVRSRRWYDGDKGVSRFSETKF
jgi:hypothetical protein